MDLRIELAHRDLPYGQPASTPTRRAGAGGAAEQAPWQQLQPLLDIHPALLVMCSAGWLQLVISVSGLAGGRWRHRHGMVMLSSHSKGAIWRMAVVPAARVGYARLLVQTLLDHVSISGCTMVSLTTRIPDFFASFGFQPCGLLDDGTTAMMVLLSGPDLTESSLSQ